MPYWKISFCLIAIGSLSMAVLMFRYGHGKKASRTWGWFCLICAFWGLGGAIATSAKTEKMAYLGWQISYIGAVFLPVLYYQTILEFINRKKPKILLVIYCIGFYFLSRVFFDKVGFFGDLKYFFNEFYCFYWPSRKSLAFLLFYIGFHWILLVYSFLILFFFFLKSKGVVRNQAKYFMIGSMGGFIGGHFDFLVAFGVNLYPYANFLIAIYPFIVGYGIIRYRLMDISIAITRTGIFIIVYSFVLGIPFAMAFGWQEKLYWWFGNKWWMIPLVSSTILATLGPFIYLFIQKKAEDKLLQEQKRYQATLRNASMGMGRIKNLTKLLNLIVHIVTKTVRIERGAIYLYDEIEKKYLLKGMRSIQREKQVAVIDRDSKLIKYLAKKQEPIIYEEVNQRARDYNDNFLFELGKSLKELNAEVLIPSFIEDKLIAFLVLGKKRSGELYSSDDLTVFSILSSQAALAIENAQFYEDVRRTQEQLFQAEKMATIGTMADGLSHQINNRLHALGFIAGDAMDTIKLKTKNSELSPDISEMLKDIEHSLNRILDNVKQGGEIVEGLLKYTRKGESGFEAVRLGNLIDASIEMAQYKVKLDRIKLNKNFSEDLPAMRGNFTQLQEVFFNLIDNAYDALMQRKEELKEPEYSPQINISAQSLGHMVEIILEDNGMGVREEDKEKLFTPFFTTKLSSKKGTGLGLYVIRKIIEGNHGGEVFVSSVYGKGTTFKITVPIDESGLS